ncbi:MAG: response regulator, partial [Gammaproteobacteria bacterium]|nr:response regulator [Gammaproteobacteria bacterium]
MIKILVVDDRPENVTLLEDFLESAGYEVASAMDGEKGLKQAEKVLPDLIISDILMPNVDGFQFCHMVRKNPALTDIPFLFLTGAYVSEEDEKFAFELGANRFIRRPFMADELLNTVEEVLNSNPSTSLHMPTDMDEEVYVKQHMGRLTQTLEDKVVELEQVTEENTKLLKDAQSHEAQLQQSLEELQATQAYLVQSERLSAVGQLVAGVAHELNNPLAIILGYTQLILRMPEASTRMTECL